MNDKQQNQREYYRVVDEVALIHRPIETDDKESLDVAFDIKRQDFSLMSHLYYMRDQYSPQMHLIEQTSPSTAEYLRMLEKQIDALCSRIVEKSERLDPANTVIADISAAGVCFPSKLEYQTGDMMELAIMLFPSRTAFLSFARVVRSQPDKDSAEEHGWKVAVKYEHLHHEDKENLIKHVHQVQMEHLRKRSESVYRDS